MDLAAVDSLADGGVDVSFLLLRVHPEPDGAWSAWVGPLHGKAEHVRVDAERVAALRVDMDALRRAPAVCIQGHAARRERAEEALGRRLAVLLSEGAAASVVGLVRGLARAEGVGVCLLVDAPLLPEVPWELIAWSPWDGPVESALGRVARLGGSITSAGTREGAGHLRALHWCPSPEDPACRRTLDSLRACAQESATECWPLESAPAPEPDVAEVLFIVCHGRVVEGGGELLLGAGTRHAGAIGDTLGHALRRASLVVVDTCSGASPEAAALSRFTSRLLRAGAQACVAPAGLLDLEAGQRFSASLLRALASGRGLADAVGAGRRAVGELAHPHPSARPYNLQLIVTSAEALRAGPPVERAWSPPGWPRVSPKLRALLGRAHGLALEWGQAHVGVEHLVQATGAQVGGPGVRAAYSALMQAGPSFWRGLRALWVQDDAPIHATPRLARLGAQLPEGASVRALWEVMVSDPHSGLHALTDANLAELVVGQLDDTATLQVPRARREGRPPATVFEVLWGPHCGQRFAPAPGQHLGRAALKEAPELQLYTEGTCTDRKLSRRHLRFLGPGRVERLRAVSVVAAGGVTPPPAEKGVAEVLAGDVLRLTEATWLRALG